MRRPEKERVEQETFMLYCPMESCCRASRALPDEVAVPDSTMQEIVSGPSV
jgi:hypothetical protein